MNEGFFEIEVRNHTVRKKEEQERVRKREEEEEKGKHGKLMRGGRWREQPKR